MSLHGNLLLPDKVQRMVWTKERIAHLGRLVERGYDAPRIAADPIINCSQGAVYRAIERCGMSLRITKGAAQVPLDLPAKVHAWLIMAAEQRAMSRAALIRMILQVLADEPTLLDNVLDDGRSTA